MLRICPGKEEEFRGFKAWLGASAALESVIDATELDEYKSSPRGIAATDKALSLVSGSLSKRGSGDVRGCALDLRSGAWAVGDSAMWANIYVADKLRELDRERLEQINHAELQKLGSRRPPVFGWLAGTVGRSLRRIGETLELWATPASEREILRVALARTRRSD